MLPARDSTSRGACHSDVVRVSAAAGWGLQVVLCVDARRTQVYYLSLRGAHPSVTIAPVFPGTVGGVSCPPGSNP